jgi:aerobic carbon-monoxide dehydrogenase medium subunit
MLLRSLRYGRPGSLGEAIEMLTANPGARPLAGGQSLLNVLKHRAADVDAVIDISRLEELRAIDADGAGALEIGAACSYDRIAGSDAVAAAHPKVAEVAAGLVDQQVRCRGTIGGNACFNDPGSNFPPLLVALEATMRVAGPNGEREVAAEDFFRDTYSVALEPGELLKSIALAPAGSATVGYSSLQAEDSWAVARAVARVSCNGTIAAPRVVIGCVSGAQPRAAAVESALEGVEPSAEAIAAAAELSDQGIEPPNDVHASADYRRKMAKVMVRRAIAEATEVARRGDG